MGMYSVRRFCYQRMAESIESRFNVMLVNMPFGVLQVTAIFTAFVGIHYPVAF